MLTDGAMRRLSQHSWPGNVRELENCLERATVMSESGTIEAHLISIERLRDTGAMSSVFSGAGRGSRGLGCLWRLHRLRNFPETFPEEAEAHEADERSG